MKIVTTTNQTTCNHMFIKNRLVIAVCLLFIFCQSKAQEKAAVEKKIYTTHRINKQTPTIDGNLGDDVWKSVDWGGAFRQYKPHTGESPSQATAFKILYDAKNLYVAFKCYDTEPDKIDRRMSRRDGFEGDRIEINIDSYFDHVTAFSFTVSASGVIGDEAITQNGDNWDESWNPIWLAKTAIDDEGWTAEIKIPLSQLRFSNKDKQVWGFQIMRYLLRKQERSLWQPYPASPSGWVHLFGELHGIEGIKPQKQVEIAPYMVAKMERFKKEVGNPFATGKDQAVSFGIDGKVGIGNNLTLDFTINPDFGQVEADPSQVNLGAFQVFFEEKRPFFIEGRNILNYTLTQSAWGGSYSEDNLFYSRRIGRTPHYYPDGEFVDQPANTAILGAFKLTGKTKKGLSIGILESVTTQEKAAIDNGGVRSKQIVEPWTNYFIARLQQDFNKGKTQIGGIFTATNRNLSDSTLDARLHKSAYSGGLDFVHNWKDRKYYVAGNITASHVIGTKSAITRTQEASEHFFQRIDFKHNNVDATITSLTGTGGMLKFGRAGTGKIKYQTGVTWRSPKLELNDVGFMNSGNVISQWTWVGFRTQKPFGAFRSAGINMNEYINWDFDGNNTGMGINFNSHFQLKNYWSFGLGSTVNASRFSTTLLRGGPLVRLPGSQFAWFFIDSDERKKVNIGVHAFASWGNNAWRKSMGFQSWITYQPTNALKISLRPSFNISERAHQYIGKVDNNGTDQYITALINRKTTSIAIRANYSIRPNLTVEFYGQPFVFKSAYESFKKITDGTAKDYQDRFHTFTNAQINFNKIDNNYAVDDNLDGNEDFTIRNPDFNFLQYRANLVVRWEYKPGSTLFVVWNKERTENPDLDNFGVGNLAGEFLDPLEKAHNVFLVKYTYRFVL